MIDLASHPYFTEYTDPETGVKSYILNKKVSQGQQHFYFTNTSLTFDSKYLWIRCINEPALIQTLAVVSLDPNKPFIHQYQGAGFSGVGNLPQIIPGEHDVVFAEGVGIYKVTLDGKITKLFELDENITRNRMPERVLTHTSISYDKKYIVLDTFVGDATYVSVADINTGEQKLITKMGGMYNHGQFSPVDPNLFIIDQDGWTNMYSGEHFGFNNRIWLMTADGKTMEPLIPTSFFEHDGSILCHDFWALDGTLCYIDYKKGAYECNVKTREHIHVWKRPVCHVHTNANRSLWVADQTPYEWKDTPCRVIFYDRATDKEIDIFSALPYPNMPVRNGSYHIDPHPAFSDDGEYIISTTTVNGGDVDVAITPVKPLLELCREKGTKVTE